MALRTDNREVERGRSRVAGGGRRGRRSSNWSGVRSLEYPGCMAHMGLSFSIGSLTRVSFLTLLPIFQTACKRNERIAAQSFSSQALKLRGSGRPQTASHGPKHPKPTQGLKGTPRGNHVRSSCLSWAEIVLFCRVRRRNGIGVLISYPSETGECFGSKGW